MLTDTHEKIDFIFSDEIMKIANPSYKERPSQIEAAHKISEALLSYQHTILEGSCGFGKTYAYLIPLFQNIIDHDENKRVIIVTNGISLQEQLYYSDIPAIQRIFKAVNPENNISCTLLKGRANYICLEKIAALTQNLTPVFDEKVSQIVDEYKRTGSIKEMDISTFDYVPDFSMLSEVACVDPEECSGQNCGFYEPCAYHKTRRKALLSNIVVTNYHLLFTDYKVGGKMLGEYDVIVFDEAHDIQNVFRDFLEIKISERTFEYINKKITELGNKDANIKDLFINRDQLQYCLQIAARFFERVQRSLFVKPSKIDSILIRPDMKLCNYEEEVSDLQKSIDYLKGVILRIFNHCSNTLTEREEMGERDSGATKMFYSSKSLLEKIIEIQKVLMESELISASEEKALWVENNPFDKNRNFIGSAGVSIHTKPVVVKQEMYDTYFSPETTTCILTSATLSVNESFNYLKESIGLDLMPKERLVVEYIGISPFDLSNQEIWYLPKESESGDNRNTALFREKLPAQVLEIIEAAGGGALCLFTSYANMNLVYNEIVRKVPRHIRLLKQGDLPKIKLLEVFREDKNSCLIATKSFFQGVDIPGESLRVLIVDKLPFPNPTDPIMIKLQDIYGSKTFKKISVPEMIIALKQAVGRGVRSVDDKCVVSILDGRMSTARYKKTIYGSFPYEKKGTREIEDVREFFQQ